MPICKCGRQIMFGKTPEGKFIPLDCSAPVYSDVTPEYEAESGTLRIERNVNAFVSHFATCPNANEFSRRKSKEETREKAKETEANHNP